MRDVKVKMPAGRQEFEIVPHVRDENEEPSSCNCQLPTANCQLPTANCLLPTAYCQLPTVNRLLIFINNPFLHHKLHAAHYLDIFNGIAVDSDDIGPFAFFNTAGFIADPDQIRSTYCR
jgi:hypothetical protein